MSSLVVVEENLSVRRHTQNTHTHTHPIYNNTCVHRQFVQSLYTNLCSSFDDFSFISRSVRSWVFVVCADVVLFGGGTIAIKKCGIE